jgi:hypothetical protein
VSKRLSLIASSSSADASGASAACTTST